MPFNFRLYFIDFYYSLFRSKGTPARLSRKRVFLLLFLFLFYPLWNIYIRIGYALDKLFFPQFKENKSPDPIFIIGNYRSGSTFFHRLLLRDDQFTCLKAWEIYFAPALVHRSLIRFILKVSKFIGSPVQKAVAADRSQYDLVQYPRLPRQLLNSRRLNSHHCHCWKQVPRTTRLEQAIQTPLNFPRLAEPPTPGSL